MTSYEQKEILAYAKIYFLGLYSKKIEGTNDIQLNRGFDYDNYTLKIIFGDHIAYRYEVCGTLGKGAFGQVVKAYDHKKREYVALKIIKNKPKYTELAEREIQILKKLLEKNDEDSKIIQVKEFFYFRNHVIISFEMLNFSLYQYLKSGGFNGLPEGLNIFLTRQILQGLKVIHESNIIHCDLKPENILLKGSNNFSVKIIDFGSSCYTNRRLFNYIQSRFYRSPEIILGLKYGTPIDM